MKRTEIIKSLIKEGFTEKTLVKFSDKQINDLSQRILGEGVKMIPKDKQQDVEAAKQNKETFVAYEDDVSEEDKNPCWDGYEQVGMKKKNGKRVPNCVPKVDEGETLDVNEVKSWVNFLIDENLTNFTSKKEIMELVSEKLKDSKPKIPEFMTYDKIKDLGTSVETAPAPVKEPGVKPTRNPTRTPYRPTPGKNPKPKAKGLGEDEKEY